MIKVKVSCGNKDLPELLMRQTPNRLGIWQNVKFITDESARYYDWWVVLHDSALLQEETVQCDPRNTIFVSMEPPIWGKNDEFNNQFNYIISCDSRINHERLYLNNAITWWAGINVKFENGHKFLPEINYDYDDFKNLRCPKKANKISVITSSKTNFPGHRKRIEFLNRLKAHDINQFIDFYGGGGNPVDDKLDALLPYKYHLVLENSNYENYWSEKIADPFLAWCLPIYFGCPNIEDYFPQDSVVKIDINNFDETLKILYDLINNDVFTPRLKSINTARNLILDDYNIFNTIAKIATGPALNYQDVTLKPSSFFKGKSNIFRRIFSKTKSLIQSRGIFG